jgi:hypothetical protein
MKKISELSNKTKKLLIISIIAIVVILLSLIYVLTNTKDSPEELQNSDPNTPSSYSELDFTDLSSIEGYFSTDITTGYLTSGCCTKSESTELSTILSNELSTGNFNTTTEMDRNIVDDAIAKLDTFSHNEFTSFSTIKSETKLIIFTLDSESMINGVYFYTIPQSEHPPISYPDSFVEVESTPRVGIAFETKPYGGIKLNENGIGYQVMNILVETKNVDLSTCVLTYKTILDDGNDTIENKQISPVLQSNKVTLVDGRHEFTIKCAGVPTGEKYYRVADKQPRLCKDYSFETSPTTVTSISELNTGIIGRWEGCVKNPWVPYAYWIEIEFKQDGSYTTKSMEKLDGRHPVSLYYNNDDPSALKRYRILNLYGENIGGGELDISHGTTAAIGTLREIKLMGNRLYMEFFHKGEYGPIEFRLNKK